MPNTPIVPPHTSSSESANDSHERHSSHITDQRENPSASISDHHETLPSSPLDIHEYCETKTLDGKGVSVLNPETFQALASYENHPDRLVEIVARKEIQALHNERDTERRALEGQKRTIILSGNYPQGWDSTVIAFDKRYKARETEILTANKPKAQALVQELQNKQGQTLLQNTAHYLQETETKDNIRRGLGFLDEKT